MFFKLSEAKEEANVVLDEITQVGYLEYAFEDKLDDILAVYVFYSDRFSGEIRESEGI